jgi:hypothetical protein
MAMYCRDNTNIAVDVGWTFFTFGWDHRYLVLVCHLELRERNRLGAVEPTGSSVKSPRQNKKIRGRVGITLATKVTNQRGIAG